MLETILYRAFATQWQMLLIVAAVGCYACGYSAGASGARSTFANFILPLLIAVVITLIADLDRPRGGLIGIKQQPMLDLRESLHVDQPAAEGEN